MPTLYFRVYGGPLEGNTPLTVNNRSITASIVSNGVLIERSGVTDINGLLEIDFPETTGTNGIYTLTLEPLGDKERLLSVDGANASAPGYTFTASLGQFNSFAWRFKTAYKVTFYARNICYPKRGFIQYPVGVTIEVSGEVDSFTITTAASIGFVPEARAEAYLYSTTGIASISYPDYEFRNGGGSNASDSASNYPIYDFYELPVTFSPGVPWSEVQYWSLIIAKIGGCSVAAPPDDSNADGGVWVRLDSEQRVHVLDRGGTAGSLRYRRSTSPVSNDWNTGSAPAGADIGAYGGRFDITPDGTIRAVFTSTSGNGMMAFSDDDGVTWETAVEIFTGMKRLTIDATDEGVFLYAARDNNGLIWGRFQAPMTSLPAAAFVMQERVSGSLVSLVLDDRQFHLDEDPGETGDLVLVGTKDGVLLAWRSTDNMVTWERM